MTLSVATFYRFVSLPDYQDLRPWLLELCQNQELKGSILLAQEGINATLAGSRASLDAFLEALAADARLSALKLKWSTATEMPFQRLKVRLKQEIVTLGVPVDPTQAVGTYVSPQEWNALIQDPEVLLIDTRNHYEVRIGSFQGAVDPQTQSFREFPKYVRNQLNPEQHRKVAMFCTGGIRCEKASSYLLEQGFDEVYHLQGGILNYLEQIPEQDSLWEGECFVFDERVAVEQGVNQGQHSMCLGCGQPVSEAERQSPLFEEGVTCPACYAQRSSDQKARARERQRQKR